MTHRNGRFINNIFVPNDAQVPSEVVVTTRQENSPRIGKMISDDFQVQSVQIINLSQIDPTGILGYRSFFKPWL